MGRMRAPVEFVELAKRESSKFIKNARREVQRVLLAARIRDVLRGSGLAR
jgi:hypothetical protein